MNRIDVEDLSRADDCRNVQVALRRRRWSNARGFIGETDMKRISIDVAVNGDSLNAHLLAGPNDAASDLAAVSDQDLLELAWIEGHKQCATKKHKMHKKFSCAFCASLWLTSDPKEWLAVLHRLPILHINLNYFTRSFRLNLVHEFHGLDNADNSFGLYAAPDLHKRVGTRRWRTIKRAYDG